MKVSVFVSAFAATLFATHGLYAAEAKPIAVVTSPVAGQAVATSSRVMIEMLGPGHPIIAVRSKEKNSYWWIQEAAKSVSSREYAVDARFGNENTDDRTEFEIVAMVAENARAAASFKLGTAVKQLPAELVQSKMVDVVLDRTESFSHGATLSAELMQPIPNGLAQRLQRVSVRMSDHIGAQPLLLVRSMERNSPWWVQDVMQSDGKGNLTGLARIGNEKTPAGSRFLMMLVVPNTESARAVAVPGTSMKEIAGFQRSRVFAITTGDGSTVPDGVPAS